MFLELISTTIPMILSIIFVYFASKRRAKERKKIEDTIKNLEKPSKEKDLFSETIKICKISQMELEKQFLQASQSSLLIFYISVTVILTSLGGLVYATNLALNKEKIDIAILMAIGSIITQFVGATFMYMYKNSILQINENIKVLEKFSKMGIALEILNTIEDCSEIKNAKIDIAKKIIE